MQIKQTQTLTYNEIQCFKLIPHAMHVVSAQQKVTSGHQKG